MSRFVLSIFSALALTISTGSLRAEERNEGIRKSVVKVLSIRRTYSLSTPWKRNSGTTVSGSGVILSTTNVLTNYHVVAQTTDVSISLDGTSERLSATVEAIAPGIDLALLKLDEPLPESAVPLTIAETTPPPGTTIQVLGYPKGGESLSITEGVISRVEYAEYRFHTRGLRTQIDAALNDGNSGGPMIAGGRVVGITFSGLSSSDGIGYAIPCEEIQLALKDMQDGNYDGKARLWIWTQGLQAKEMRRWLNMPDTLTGMRFASAQINVDDYPLRINDVITKIGSYNVNNQGKVAYNDTTQVPYGYAVEREAEIDGKQGFVSVHVFRDGTEMELQVPVFRDGRFLLRHHFDNPPPYFVYGPIVFSVASADFTESIGLALSRGGSAGRSLYRLIRLMQTLKNPYWTRQGDRVTAERQQLVVIQKLISNRMTRDIKVPLPGVVKKVNGKPVTNLRQVAELINGLSEDLLVIEFEDVGSTTIVLDRSEIESKHDEIMEENGIVRSASRELRDVWDR